MYPKNKSAPEKEEGLCRERGPLVREWPQVLSGVGRYLRTDKGSARHARELGTIRMVLYLSR